MNKRKERRSGDRLSVLEVPMDYRTFFDLANAIMVILDARGRVIMINPKGCQMLGYKMDKIVGKRWFDHFVPLNERRAADMEWKRILKGKAKIHSHFESSVIRSNGERRLISWNNTLITDAEGKVSFVLRSGEDVTKLKNVPSYAIFVFETDGTILDVNPIALSMLGYERKELVGSNIRQFCSPNSARKMKLELKKILKFEPTKTKIKNMIQEGLVGFRVDFIRKDNQVLPLFAFGHFFEISGKKVFVIFHPIH